MFSIRNCKMFMPPANANFQYLFIHNTLNVQIKLFVRKNRLDTLIFGFYWRFKGYMMKVFVHRPVCKVSNKNKFTFMKRDKLQSSNFYKRNK